METTESNIVKIQKVARAGIPPAFSERCVVRITSHKFGPNSKHKPMITISGIELLGYFKTSKEDPIGVLSNIVEKGGQTYILTGLDCKPAYFTIGDDIGLDEYRKFYNKANPGEDLTELDVNNPALEYLTGLTMQCIVSGRMEPYRRPLTEEEKAEKVAAGEKPVGDVITNDEGKPIEVPVLQVRPWLKKYTGELPENTPPY